MNQYNAEFWNALDELVNNSEIKILIGCTEEKQSIIYETHNKTPSMNGISIRR